MSFWNLLSLGYWFEIQPSGEWVGFWILGVVFAVMVVGGIGFGLFLKTRNTDKVWVRVTRVVPPRLIGYGIGGWLFLFFRQQRAPYLSMRIWLFLYLLWVVFVVYKTVKEVRVDYDMRKTLREQRKTAKQDSYLPTTKKSTKKKKRKKRV